MGDCNSEKSVLGGEENLIAAAQHLAKVLESTTNWTDDTRKILANLSNKLSSLSVVAETKDGEKGLSDIEERLNLAQNKVMNWEIDQSMIWECGSEEAYEYVRAVEEVLRLVDTLENMSLGGEDGDSQLLRRAHDVLQTAMVRLEDEFKHMLVQNKQPYEPEQMSFRSSEDDDSSIISFGDESVDDSIHRDSISRNSEEFLVDLIHPSIIPDLKCIANLMFAANYDQECLQAFVSAQKDALDDFLFILEVEKLSIEDVMKLEWASLNSKIRRWVRAMKIFVRVYLASEKWLSDRIFGDLDSVSSACFAEASKSSMLQLLNFGEAVAIGPHQPEKLTRILDMYEILVDLAHDVDALYTDESALCISVEYQDVLRRLGECVRATFLEFENAVASNISTVPFAGGGVHHLTRYVMNYIKILTDYTETLNVLLKDPERENMKSFSPDCSPVNEEDDASGRTPRSLPPTSVHFRSLMAILECNLEEKSKLYRDESLQHLFMMNNIHYMTEKVKGAEVRSIVGDDWIRKHNWKFQQLAMNYERATWSSILSLLRDEGLQYPGSSSISKSLLKERLQNFYTAFEDVYRSQTAWLIPDTNLRDDVRISTSLKVIQAYRTFVGRHMNHLSDKTIKYNADDLENYLMDFFEGSPRSLHHAGRK